MKEYLSTLNTRNKWNEEKGNIAPGDVVLMVDPGNSRGHWPLSRIQEVLPGPDGKVKVVRVRTGKDYVTNHKVVSVRDIKRTKGTEHSPVRGGGCSGEGLALTSTPSAGTAEQNTTCKFVDLKNNCVVRISRKRTTTPNKSVL